MMTGKYSRTDYCGVLRMKDIGREVTVCGFIQKQRDLGFLIFADVRDRSGICQLVVEEGCEKWLYDTAFSLRAEFVVRVTGVVRERDSKNPELPTGDIEILASNIEVLSRANTPPFAIEENSKVQDALRLKFRYLDLRRPDLQRNLMLRHRVSKLARDYFDENGFLEIETPMLIKSTPEGARDYLVPSRVHPGSFYALPQSPQMYKQLLMLSGFDRYFQIVRCFRDEDLRADRQPEFTQIDIEMSFADENNVMEVNEGFAARLMKEIKGIDIKTPLLRMTYSEAMERFGSDKPDIRFGFEIKNLSRIFEGCGFKVFADAIENGGSVRAINVKGAESRFSRKDIDGLTEFVKTYRAKGLAFMKLSAEGISSPIAKFFSEEEISRIKEAMDAETGDLLFFVSDKDEVVFDALGALRTECAKRLDILDPNEYSFLWVTDFPLYEWDEESGRFAAKHHPFTSPAEISIKNFDTDPKNAKAKAYDLVLNGVEVGGGSVRIHDPHVQERMFKALGFSKEETDLRFGFLVEAFSYGAPPHAGMAYGLDRLVMLLCGADSIRDTIAFPKVQNASELMSGAPAEVEEKQLGELYLNVVQKDVTKDS